MKVRSLFYALTVALAFVACSKEVPDTGEETKEPVISLNDWTEFEHGGFTFKLRTWLKDTPDALAAIRHMEADIDFINAIIPEKALAVMKSHPVWLERDLNDGAAWYHLSKDWLASQGMMTQKAKCVEISNHVNYVSWSDQNQPLMLLHELCHLYHDQGVEGGMENSVIKAAYEHANSSGMYINTPYRYHTTDLEKDWSKTPKAYCLNNHHEYFTELSEAYWGENDYYPFNYEQLQEYDPQGFDAMVAIWGPRADKQETE